MGKLRGTTFPSWYVDDTHSVYPHKIRQYGKQSGLLSYDLPKGKTWRDYEGLREAVMKFTKVTIPKVSGCNYNKDAGWYTKWSCSHTYSPQEVVGIGITRLLLTPGKRASEYVKAADIKKMEATRDAFIEGMKNGSAGQVVEKVVTTTVTKTKTVEVPVEVPLVLTFDQRDALIKALHRSQHVANEYLRRAMLADDAAEVERCYMKLRSIVQLMRLLDIEPDDWMNGGLWLAETEVAPIVVPDMDQLEMRFS